MGSSWRGGQQGMSAWKEGHHPETQERGTVGDIYMMQTFPQK